MQTYDCKVRLGGELKNEVEKLECTAAEIMVLRHIHGSDAVVGLKKRRMDKRPHLAERERLDSIYGRKATSAVLGVPGAIMPVTLDQGTEDALAAAANAREAEINEEVDRRVAEAIANNKLNGKLTLEGVK